jgi:D-alanyl-D-alanine carboxypeptidase/D-alanyl-D-alanine-endopeptidase (penicillin-binding protein 4)
VIDLVLVPAAARNLDQDVEVHNSSSVQNAVRKTRNGNGGTGHRYGMRHPETGGSRESFTLTLTNLRVMARTALVTAGGVAAVVVLAAGAAVGGWAITSAVRPQPHPTSLHHPTPAAYRAAAATPAPAGSGAAARSSSPSSAPTAARVAARLASAVGQGALGSRLRAQIVDLSTGSVLYARGGNVPAAPASTTKLLTATAVLAARGEQYRIPTTVRAGTGGAVVLVGGGDPTLTGAAAGKPGAYPGAARISDLARALVQAHVQPSRILVDDSLFSGPTISPSWAREDVPTEYASAITPVLADGGRPAPTAVIRSAAPDIAAGHELARALGHPGLPVVHGRAASGSRVLATVRSATVGTLVMQMLLNSDNVIAESLARQVALAEHAPASFTGAASAVRVVLARLGVTIGTGFVDGSGLAARDRVTMAALVSDLRLAASTPRLRYLFDALPVAGWSGTLSARYVSTATRSAAGDVRAKTGTLTGVSSLAGTVHDRSGSTLLFALDADRAPDTAAAEAALDKVVAVLAACGC